MIINKSRLIAGASYAIVIIWLVGIGLLGAPSPGHQIVVTHWANGHLMEREALLPGMAAQFNALGFRTASGREINVSVIKANSGEISGELKSRVTFEHPIDRNKSNPGIVTPAADHWINDVNQSLGAKVLDLVGADRIVTTYVGIVTSREMAQCLGWPATDVGFGDIVRLATDPQGWSAYACARPEWGKKPQVAFTYPDRSSTARSVLFTLYSIAAGKLADQLTLADVTKPEVISYIKQFQNSIDCYVPDTLDLNQRILSRPSCAQFFFIGEDNLVQLYQGKVCVGQGDKCIPTPLDRDLVMIYPKEGSIIHNHSGFLVNADWASDDEAEAAGDWIGFLRQDAQQLAFMQEGFRPTTGIGCVNPVSSPFSQCTRTPTTLIYPDQIEPKVVEAILDTWKR